VSSLSFSSVNDYFLADIDIGFKIGFVPNVKFDGSAYDRAIYERKLLATIFRVNYSDVVNLIQIHSNILIPIFSPNFINTSIFYGDGVLNFSFRNFVLSIRTADCVPVFIVDIKNQWYAGIHSGWRGFSLGVLDRAIRQFLLYGSKPDNIFVFVLPFISHNYYEIKEDVAAYFSKGIIKRKEKLFLDFRMLIYNILNDFHIPQSHIYISNLCTYENNFLASYRRDKDKTRNINFIWKG